MTNSLEYINTRIFENERYLQYQKDILKASNNSEDIITKFHIEFLESELNHFQQIKTILEAWKVVKDKIEFTSYYENDENEHKMFVPLDQEEYQVIKKALEA